MKESVDKSNEPQRETVQKVSQESSNGGTAQLVDNRSSFAVQRKLQDSMGSSGEESPNPIQRKANNTGLPDNLKSGIENLSGYSMDDVKVHYNSSKPAQLQAHAYAQGTDIHLGSGQEKHLAHEAWHVVQQKQGRVKPTRQLKSKVNINDDDGLEREADVMGEEVLKASNEVPQNNLMTRQLSNTTTGVLQGKFTEELSKLTHRGLFNRLKKYDNSIKKFSWSDFKLLEKSETCHDLESIVSFLRKSNGLVANESTVEDTNNTFSEEVPTVSFASDGATEIVRKLIMGELSTEDPKKKMYRFPSPDLIISIFMLPALSKAKDFIERRFTEKQLLNEIVKIKGSTGNLLKKPTPRRNGQGFNNIDSTDEIFVFDLPNENKTERTTYKNVETYDAASELKNEVIHRIAKVYRNPGNYDAENPVTDGFVLWSELIGIEGTRELIKCIDSYNGLDASSASWQWRNISIQPYYGTSHLPGAAGQGGANGSYEISFDPHLYVHSNKNSNKNKAASTKVITDTGNLDTANIIAFGTGAIKNEVTFATPLRPGKIGNTTIKITKLATTT